MDDKNDLPVTNEENTPGDFTGVQPPPTLPEAPSADAANPPQTGSLVEDDSMDDRLERLGGEPAPVITPEEFARLQQAGQVHIDARGRVRTARRSDSDAGVSLRKRRAWYAR